MKILKRGISIAAVLTLFAMILVSCLSGGKMMSIAVTPATSIIAQGTTQQFIATATLSDGTTINWTQAVNWTSLDPTVATISNTAPSNGLATSPTPTLGGTIGTTTITATDPLNNLSSPAQIKVELVSSITVTTTTQTIAPGQSQQFTATALLSDGTTTQDLTTFVTWNSSNNSVATMNTTPGLATATTTTGTTNITATDPVTGKQSPVVTLTVQ